MRLPPAAVLHCALAFASVAFTAALPANAASVSAGTHLQTTASSFAFMDRLDQTIVEADTEQAVAFLGECIGRECDDGRLSRALFADTNPLCGLYAAQDRHVDIHEDQVIVAPGAEVAGYAAVFGLFDLGARGT